MKTESTTASTGMVKLIIFCVLIAFGINTCRGWVARTEAEEQAQILLKAQQLAAAEGKVIPEKETDPSTPTPPVEPDTRTSLDRELDGSVKTVVTKIESKEKKTETTVNDVTLKPGDTFTGVEEPTPAQTPPDYAKMGSEKHPGWDGPISDGNKLWFTYNGGNRIALNGGKVDWQSAGPPSFDIKVRDGGEYLIHIRKGKYFLKQKDGEIEISIAQFKAICDMASEFGFSKGSEKFRARVGISIPQS